MIISRRKLARAMVEMTAKHSFNKVVDTASELIVSEKLKIDFDLLALDLADFAKQQGVMNITVESAHTLSDELKLSVKRYLKSDRDIKEVYINEELKPELIGGIKITGPDISYDATLLNKLKKLRV